MKNILSTSPDTRPIPANVAPGFRYYAVHIYTRRGSVYYHELLAPSERLALKWAKEYFETPLLGQRVTQTNVYPV